MKQGIIREKCTQGVEKCYYHSASEPAHYARLTGW